MWFVDAKGVQGRPWGGAATTHALPKDREVTLSCGAHRPFVLVDEDESVALLPIGGPAATKPAALMRDADFGEDEQRERAEFTVGDELGVVRLSVGGALAIREVKADAMGCGLRVSWRGGPPWGETVQSCTTPASSFIRNAMREPSGALRNQ